jgi:hypothetical protein
MLRECSTRINNSLKLQTKRKSNEDIMKCKRVQWSIIRISWVFTGLNHPQMKVKVTCTQLQCIIIIEI